MAYCAFVNGLQLITWIICFIYYTVRVLYRNFKLGEKTSSSLHWVGLSRDILGSLRLFLVELGGWGGVRWRSFRSLSHIDRTLTLRKVRGGKCFSTQPPTHSACSEQNDTNEPPTHAYMYVWVELYSISGHTVHIILYLLELKFTSFLRLPYHQ